jgi:lysylphosphatidylglycerol synthetase-like protein (DUF2156 family)
MSFSSLFTAPWESLLCCVLLLVAPAIASPQERRRYLPGIGAALVVALFAPNGPIAYLAVAAGALLHAHHAWAKSRTGAITLLLSALLAVGVAAALQRDALTLAFALSCLVVAVRAGVMPFHVGVASLCDRAPVVQIQQLSSTIALVFVHLRFVDHHAAAIAAGPALVRYGAVAAIGAALMTVVQKDLRRHAHRLDRRGEHRQLRRSAARGGDDGTRAGWPGIDACLTRGARRPGVLYGSGWLAGRVPHARHRVRAFWWCGHRRPGHGRICRR